jgi:hypothetical protein
MKKIFFIALLGIAAFTLKANANKVDQFQASEQNQSDNQNITATARLKAASRLFATKDDLTSVILIIPADSLVSVLDSDSTYLHVVYEDNEGYIFKHQAVLVETQANTPQPVQSTPGVQENEQVQDQQQNRLSYLENKYGSSMASRLYQGKIWKGINSDMVKDSWGNPDKISRTVSGNTIKEKWIYRNTWLYFENNTLLEWGPVNN